MHDIKLRVRQGQLRANLKANAEMLAAYWEIGKMIHQRQQIEGWGAGWGVVNRKKNKYFFVPLNILIIFA